ncbi:MAG: hypothetical protein U1E65_24085 [Myxococcota bacterium]
MNGQPLAERLKAAIDAKGTTPDRLSDETKIPRTTVRALIHESGNFVLPPRVYLRAHALLIGAALGIPEEELGSLFDKSYPVAAEPELGVEVPRVPPVALAVAAGLAGIGILAMLVSIFR